MWRIKKVVMGYSCENKAAASNWRQESGWGDRLEMTKLSSIFQATALFVPLASLGLSACFGDSREADMKRCIAQAQQSAGQTPAQQGESAEERHDKVGELVAACMEELGYRHDAGAMANERCLDDVDYTPYCYRRR